MYLLLYLQTTADDNESPLGHLLWGGCYDNEYECALIGIGGWWIWLVMGCVLYPPITRSLYWLVGYWGVMPLWGVWGEVRSTCVYRHTLLGMYRICLQLVLCIHPQTDSLHACSRDQILCILRVTKLRKICGEFCIWYIFVHVPVPLITHYKAPPSVSGIRNEDSACIITCAS